MIIETLINKDFKALNSEMSLKEACKKFDEDKRDNMAIVDEGVFVGVLSKEQLSGQENNSESITTIKDSFRDRPAGS